MTINKKIDGDCITILLEGWLDVETTPQLSEYMQQLELSKKLVFDFNKLEYISSSGVREVVAAYRRQKDSDGEFEVINVNAEIMDVFSMTGINKKIQIKEK